MTANHEHTPTDEEMRDEFIDLQGTFANGSWNEGSLKRWNRWLAERDARIEAAAEQRGEARAFKESANEVRREMRWQYEQNINRNSDTGDSIDRLLELEKVFKYRADQEVDDA